METDPRLSRPDRTDSAAPLQVCISLIKGESVSIMFALCPVSSWAYRDEERAQTGQWEAARLGLPIYESAFMGEGAPAGAPAEHTAVCFCQGGSAPLAQLLGPRGPLALRVQRLTLTPLTFFFFSYFFWVLRQNATAQFSLLHNQSSASALASQMFSHGGKINQLAGAAPGNLPLPSGAVL